jgi:hypothetical protein
MPCMFGLAGLPLTFTAPLRALAASEAFGPP